MCISFQLHFGIGFTHTHARTHAHANTIKPLYVSVEIMLGINIELKAGQIQAVLTTFFESKRLGCLDIIPGNNEQFPFFSYRTDLFTPNRMLMHVIGLVFIGKRGFLTFFKVASGCVFVSCERSY